MLTSGIDIGRHVAARTHVRAVISALEDHAPMDLPMSQVDPNVALSALADAREAVRLLHGAGSSEPARAISPVMRELSNMLEPRVDTHTSRAGELISHTRPPVASTSPVSDLVAKARASERALDATISIAKKTDVQVVAALRAVARGSDHSDPATQALHAVADDSTVLERLLGLNLAPDTARVASRHFAANPAEVARRIVPVLDQPTDRLSGTEARAALSTLLGEVQDDLPTPAQALQINELLHVRGVREDLPRYYDVSDHGAAWVRSTYGVTGTIDEPATPAMQQEIANLRLALTKPDPRLVRDRLVELSGQPELTGSQRREILAGLAGVPGALGHWQLPDRGRAASVLGGDLLKMQNGVVPWDAEGPAMLHRILTLDGSQARRARMIELATTPGAANDYRVAREVSVLVNQTEVGEWMTPKHLHDLQWASWRLADGSSRDAAEPLAVVKLLARQPGRAADALDGLLGQSTTWTDGQLDQVARLARLANLEGEMTPARTRALEPLVDARLTRADAIDPARVELRRLVDARFDATFVEGAAASANQFALARGAVARLAAELEAVLSSDSVKNPTSALEPAKQLSRAMRWLVASAPGSGVDGPTRALADSTWEFLHRNIDRMARDAMAVSDDGFANFPDQAELGRALANARLVVGITEPPAAVAQADSIAW